ncbi:MAG: hypothetical protein AAF660_13825 [Pseudomonadota bacterium]
MPAALGDGTWIKLCPSTLPVGVTLASHSEHAGHHHDHHANHAPAVDEPSFTQCDLASPAAANTTSELPPVAHRPQDIPQSEIRPWLPPTVTRYRPHNPRSPPYA